MADSSLASVDDDPSAAEVAATVADAGDDVAALPTPSPVVPAVDAEAGDAPDSSAVATSDRTPIEGDDLSTATADLEPPEAPPSIHDTVQAELAAINEQVNELGSPASQLATAPLETEGEAVALGTGVLDGTAEEGPSASPLADRTTEERLSAFLGLPVESSAVAPTDLSRAAPPMGTAETVDVAATSSVPSTVTTPSAASGTEESLLDGGPDDGAATASQAEAAIATAPITDEWGTVPPALDEVDVPRDTPAVPAESTPADSSALHHNVTAEDDERTPQATTTDTVAAPVGGHADAIAGDAPDLHTLAIETPSVAVAPAAPQEATRTTIEEMRPEAATELHTAEETTPEAITEPRTAAAPTVALERNAEIMDGASEPPEPAVVAPLESVPAEAEEGGIPVAAAEPTTTATHEAVPTVPATVVEEDSEELLRRAIRTNMFVGHKRSRIYYPASSPHLPAPKNRLYFATEAQAAAAGFRPADEH